jgi:hypothetical protein
MREMVDASFGAEKGEELVVRSWWGGNVENERPSGLSIGVWNSSFFDTSLMVGERCAWWIGWETRT